MAPQQSSAKYSIEDGPKAQYSIEDAPPPAPSWTQSVQQSFDTNTQTNPNESLLQTGLKDIVGTIGGPFVHPLNFLHAVANSIPSNPDVVTPTNQPENPIVQRAMQVPEDYQAAGGGVKGAAYAGTKLAGDVAGGVALGEAAGAVPKVIGRVASKGADLITGGTKPAADLNTKAAAANDAATLKATEQNAKIQSARTQELSDHLAAIQKAQGEEPTTLESGRPRNPRELQSHKAALERGVEQLDTQFQNDLKNTAKDAKQQVDTKYDNLRQTLSAKVNPEDGSEMIPAPTIPSPDLASAVHNAEAQLMGSTENIKQFRDILAKHPESDPDFVTYQGAKIPQGHPLYDIINQGTESPGASFRDLQGYYSELGDKIASGGLQGDVYQAMKSLHTSIGDMMQSMADTAGVGDLLREAQSDYRDYYQTFRDPQSPLYKAIKAPERGQSIAQLQGKDITGIQALARFNPELAKRANTIRAYRAEAQSIPDRPFVEKPVSKLAPTPETISPKLQTIGPEDIEAAKSAELAKRTATVQHYVNRAALYITGYRSLVAIGRAMSGDTGALAGLPADLGEGAALVAGGNGLAQLLKSPKVSKFLTAPTPADVATISPDVARGLAPIVDAAKKQGIKISPAVSAAISAHSTKTNWFDQPN